MDIFFRKNVHYFMILAMISWGIAWPNAKILNSYFDFYDLVFLRFAFGALCLLPLILYRLKDFKFKANFFMYIIPTSLLFLGYNLSFFMGTNYGDAGKGAVFATTTNPIITYLIIFLITRKTNKTDIIGIIIGCFGGIIIMDVLNQGFINIIRLENVFFLICSVIWGMMTVFTSYAQKNIAPFPFVFLCYFTTAFFSWSLSTISLEELQNLDFIFYINFLMVSVASMGFGTTVYIYATKVIGPFKSSAYIFSVPFVALISANLILDEFIQISTILGGLLCLLSVYIINIYNKKLK